MNLRFVIFLNRKDRCRRLVSFCFGAPCRRLDRFKRHPAKTIDARQPVIVEGRIDYAVVAGRMIETFLISNDANMSETAKENQRSEPELLFLWGRSECCPKGSRWAAIKIET